MKKWFDILKKLFRFLASWKIELQRKTSCKAAHVFLLKASVPPSFVEICQMTLQKPKEREIERVVQIRTIRQCLPHLLAFMEPLLRIRTHSSSMKFLVKFQVFYSFQSVCSSKLCVETCQMTLQKPKEREIERVVQIRTIRQCLPRLLAAREPLLRIRTHSSSMKEEGAKCIQMFLYRTLEQNSKAVTNSDSI